MRFPSYDAEVIASSVRRRLLQALHEISGAQVEILPQTVLEWPNFKTG